MWVGAFIMILKIGLGEFSFFLEALHSWCSLLQALVYQESLYTRGLRARRKEPSQWLVLACNSRYTWAFNFRARTFYQAHNTEDGALMGPMWIDKSLVIFLSYPRRSLGSVESEGSCFVCPQVQGPFEHSSACHEFFFVKYHSPLQISLWACLL